MILHIWFQYVFISVFYLVGPLSDIHLILDLASVWPLASINFLNQIDDVISMLVPTQALISLKAECSSWDDVRFFMLSLRSAKSVFEAISDLNESKSAFEAISDFNESNDCEMKDFRFSLFSTKAESTRFVQAKAK